MDPLKLSQLEQSIWAATFANNLYPIETAAMIATRRVEEFRTLRSDTCANPLSLVDELLNIGAKDGIQVTEQEFRIWYIVGKRIEGSKHSGGKDPSEAEIVEAYRGFQMSKSDFY